MWNQLHKLFGDVLKSEMSYSHFERLCLAFPRMSERVRQYFEKLGVKTDTTTPQSGGDFARVLTEKLKKELKREGFSFTEDNDDRE